jgi:hypothetical protein
VVAAILVCEPNDSFYRTIAVAPAGRSAPPLQKGSKLLSLVRLLGKPLEVPQTESGWLQQQLPPERFRAEIKPLALFSLTCHVSPRFRNILFE